MGEASFGKYRLIAELGHGGMADVFLAVQAGPAGSNFRKLSVIKRLRQNLVEEPEFVEMLIEEARIAARLNHPNVVQTNEVGEVDQQYFIAMEYLDGQPLHRIQHRTTQRLKEGKPSPIGQEQQMIIVIDALAGLHHAHGLADYDGSPLAIVHRDVTPQNIFVTYEGQVKVVDFGIAKAAGRASETRQGVVKGKVRYMAPEQAIGQSVDCRADVFSMGIMLWEVVTSKRMWKDVDDLEIVRRLVDGTHPSSPRDVDPNVHEELDRICRKALATDREDRYASAEDFRADLEQYIAESGRLVEARRKLAPAVSELFEDKRTEIRAVIEKQLSALAAAANSGEFSAVPMPSDSVSSATHFSQTISRRPAALASDVPVPAEARSSRKRGAATAAVAVALACVLGVIAWRLVPDRTASSATKAPVVEEVTLHLKATPEVAKVSVDDGPLQSAPLDLRVPKDTKPHHVRFEAEGFAPRTEDVRFAADLAISVALVPLPAVAKSPLAKTAPERPTTAAVAAPARNVAAAAPPQAAAAGATPVVEPPTTASAPTTASEMPAKDHKKPKIELENGDPWANK